MRTPPRTRPRVPKLIQELNVEGCHGVTGYKRECDKIMRLHAQAADIENGFVFVPETAPWLVQYLHEMTVRFAAVAHSIACFVFPRPGGLLIKRWRAGGSPLFISAPEKEPLDDLAQSLLGLLAELTVRGNGTAQRLHVTT